ncbi:MAG: Membrane protein [Aeromicrobium sp.]|jgi:hypothetical protein|uniref:DUF7144 family membrane protein n=1 Tax=Aeromicrobium sp. TaxID=1871063 RepID=UPI002623DC09|nr:hypothetical protein [Aeromicrobium sp.]MCW2825362.1 Membrane protein [Aeromicrobium sp.]
MSDVHMSGHRQSEAGRSAEYAPMSADTRDQTAWVGWIVFAGMMLMLVGSFHVIQGFVALFRDEVFVVGQKGLVLNVDYTAWGWTHIIGGAIAILVGGCLLAGQMWARIIAVIVAALSAIVNVAFLPAYPIWSVMMIAVDVLVIWAITVHGSEVKS